MRVIHRMLVAAAAAVALPALGSGAVAFITDLKGEVAIDGNPRPPLLSELARGQKITVGRDASVSVMYIASGTEYALRGPGEFQVKEAEVAGASAARQTAWRADEKVLVQIGQSAAASVRMRSAAKPKQAAAAAPARELSKQELERLEKRRPAAGAQFSDRLLYAVLLFEAGATQQAREAWSRLAEERPDLPELGALARP